MQPKKQRASPLALPSATHHLTIFSKTRLVMQPKQLWVAFVIFEGWGVNVGVIRLLLWSLLVNCGWGGVVERES
jgi:hypothetical protein